MIRQSGSINFVWTKVLDDRQLETSIGSPLLFVCGVAHVQSIRQMLSDVNREPLAFYK
jgi:hypothetical protein